VDNAPSPIMADRVRQSGHDAVKRYSSEANAKIASSYRQILTSALSSHCGRSASHHWCCSDGNTTGVPNVRQRCWFPICQCWKRHYVEDASPCWKNRASGFDCCRSVVKSKLTLTRLRNQCDAGAVPRNKWAIEFIWFQLERLGKHQPRVAGHIGREDRRKAARRRRAYSFARPSAPISEATVGECASLGHLLRFPGNRLP
jgi:hypothetical protein